MWVVGVLLYLSLYLLRVYYNVYYSRLIHYVYYERITTYSRVVRSCCVREQRAACLLWLRAAGLECTAQRP